MRARGQRAPFFQLPQLLAAVEQSRTCHSLKLSYNDITSQDIRNYLLPFLRTTRLQKVLWRGRLGRER